MTQNFHTPLLSGEAANAAKINAPLGELDTALTTLEARVDVIEDAVLLNGAAVTLADGAASAGQKVVDVDDATIFVAGCGVEYQLAGGTLEYNTVGTVNSGTRITLASNIGAGGIPNDGVISVVPVGLYNLLGRNDAGLFVGGNTPSTDDAAVLIGRAASNPLATAGSHAVRDESTYSTAAEGGYASFDSIPIMGGVGAHNHLVSFQARPQFAGSNSLGACWGLTFQPDLSDGDTTYVLGMRVYDAVKGGDATIALQAALWVDELTAGTSNYVVYSNGSTPSYFGGKIQTGGDVQAAGVVSGSNLVTNGTSNTVKIGTGITAADVYVDTLIGHDAGHSLSDGVYNVMIGTKAGYSSTSGDYNVFVGNRAGYYETGDDKLFIDNRDRGSEAVGRTEALIYGVFAASSTNQELRFNAGKLGFFGQAPVAKPTGVAVSAAGIHAALVTLGLIAA